MGAPSCSQPIGTGGRERGPLARIRRPRGSQLMVKRIWLCALVAMGCGRASNDRAPEVDRGAPRASAVASFPLVPVRAALRTQIFGDAEQSPAPEPPAGVFIKTYYQRGSDSLVAYETPVVEGARRPAVVWIAGGFNWGIDANAWTQGAADDDQSATMLRPPGIVLMRPSLRGANDNPGRPECFLGEVDDILAAADHIAQRPDVDPSRIYLGGHSTGGTLALLAAASTARFRAVFAFGPVADPRDYGADGCLPSHASEDEVVPRAPMAWMNGIVTPTFVIEGEHGNVAAFPDLARTASRAVSFTTVPGADHFSVLQPASRHIARAILADRGPRPELRIDAAAIAADVAR
ncbi:MAG: prolyl oligopeptidase family serine peptidase [Myxococcales bacterium]|nr:prolyl oligopeptidase family serine peptidase [Myxococcales bacterium]